MRRTSLMMLLGLGLFASGCGRDDFGSIFFRVWRGDAVLSGAGNCTPTPPLDTTTFYDAMTVVVYEGLDGKFFLDANLGFGNTVLEGTVDGDNYNFSGTDTTYNNANPLVATTRTITATFTTAGDDVTGNTVEVETVGTTAGCTITIPYTGVRVYDVVVDYRI